MAMSATTSSQVEIFTSSGANFGEPMTTQAFSSTDGLPSVKWMVALTGPSPTSSFHVSPPPKPVMLSEPPARP
ncbi:hypothetical protein D3C72_2083360 [compost metagenome]